MNIRWRSVLRDLLPPILIRSFRRQRVVPNSVSGGAVVHEVTGGPLKGARLLLDLSTSAYRAMGDGSYDDFVWPALPDASSVDGLILDIGAHVGYDGLALARLHPGRDVFAFEPNPVNLVRIEANLALNPDLAKQVHVIPVALADRTGELAFHTSDQVDDETSSGGHLGVVRPPLEPQVYARAGFKETKVPVRRLDDIAGDRKWGRVALIKIDVEGAEHLVLQGAQELLRRDRPFLCVEVHSVVCMLALSDLLHPLGYRVSMLKEDRPSRAYIIASCD